MVFCARDVVLLAVGEASQEHSAKQSSAVARLLFYPRNSFSATYVKIGGLWKRRPKKGIGFLSVGNKES